MNKGRGLAVLGFFILALSVSGFTQSGVGVGIGFGIPMGHEWITRFAAVELIDKLPFAPDDPRRHWSGPNGKAKNLDVSSLGAQAEVRRITSRRTSEDRYRSQYEFVFDAIIGERWVDAGGFNVTKSKFIDAFNCWDAVAQEPPEIQNDHYMRRYDDREPAGGYSAMTSSQQRFKDYFVAAAMAPMSRMIVWDGGAYSAQYEVDRNYFLFGRAAHLFEDSFSPEHTVRMPDDNFERVRQVKAYLCSSGAEQHSHKVPTVKDFSNRDVIWKDGTNTEVGWASYRAANMRPAPLVSTEATKDLWAAFIRTMGTPVEKRHDVAAAEADTLVKHWLDGHKDEIVGWYDDESHRDDTYVLAAGQTGKGVTVAQCMDTIDKKWKGDQMAAVRALAAEQRVCLYNIMPVAGYSDLFDPSMHMPFNWDWQWTQWRNPTDGWTIPNRPADTGTRYRLVSKANGQYVGAPAGLKDGALLHARAGVDPLGVTLVGDLSNGYFRATFAPWLFVSYNAGSSGNVKLYAGKRAGEVWLQRPTADAAFAIVPAADASAIRNLHWNQFIWLYQDSLELNKHGNPGDVKSRWTFEKQP